MGNQVTTLRCLWCSVLMLKLRFQKACGLQASFALIHSPILVLFLFLLFSLSRSYYHLDFDYDLVGTRCGRRNSGLRPFRDASSMDHLSYITYTSLLFSFVDVIRVLTNPFTAFTNSSCLLPPALCHELITFTFLAADISIAYHACIWSFTCRFCLV